MEAGRREETGKLEGESGSRRSMFMVRQFVVVMLWGWWREAEVGRRGEVAGLGGGEAKGMIMLGMGEMF